jgi:ribonuclease HII
MRSALPRPALWAFDEQLRAGLGPGCGLAGIDEAGRGPLAGPVLAAAALLDPARPIAGLDDSKKLSATRRKALEGEILAGALAWGCGAAEAGEIDRIGILRATFAAMARALAQLEERLPPGETGLYLLVDGRDFPFGGRPGRALIGGDGLSASVAAASILAKQERDRRMLAAEARWPGYGFAGHKGYGSAAHLEALARLGPCPLHRRSFRPLAGDGQGRIILD